MPFDSDGESETENQAKNKGSENNFYRHISWTEFRERVEIVQSILPN